MKKIAAFAFTLFCFKNAEAQTKYYTNAGHVWFDAGTGAEDITGINKSTTSVFVPATGQLQFSLIVKGFEFWSQLMQDHFNENYMESDKFPKAIFKGNITNMDKVTVTKDGTYPVTVKGILDMHGVKKELETKGSLKLKGETIEAIAEFVVVMDDYKIEIPSVVKDKLSKTAKIKINCTYTILK